MADKHILYFGNNLGKRSLYATSLDILSDKLRSEGFRVTVSSDKRNKLLRMADMIKDFFIYAPQVDYILIDTFSTANFWYALVLSQLSRLFGKKYIPILRGGDLPQRLDRNPRLGKMIFNHSYANVAPSGYLKHEFEKRGYRTEFIPNILDISQYPYKERHPVRPRLLYVRAFAKHYNPGLAVEVLKKLKEKYPEAELCMVGPDKDGTMAEVKQLAEDYGLSDSVRFTGVLPKPEWHKLSEDYDIFINTTNVDNTPVSVMEAMALGLPVVSTNVGGLPYLIEDGRDGILVEPDNPDAFAAAVEDLIENPAKAVSLSRNARRKAESFDWQEVRRKWLELLK